MSHLSIDLLGQLQVSVEGNPIQALESPKVRALLAYLVMEAAQPQSRTYLIGLLWPDYPEESARHNLRQALYNLRSLIGDHDSSPPYFLVTRETIQFNKESDHFLDIEQFNRYFFTCEEHLSRCKEDCSTRAERLGEMVKLYRGEFLKQLYVEGSAEFEEWTLVHRESLHQRVLEAHCYLANYYELHGDFKAARQHATRQLELDPWREEAHRQMMRALALDGLRSAAIEQYDTCRSLLSKELDVEPSPKTRELYNQIRLGTLTQETNSLTYINVPAVTNFPVQLSPFVGRERELAELGQLIVDPGCRLITLVGTGGIGKTRLAIQAAEQHSDEFTHGSVFISLASIGSIEAVIPAIANGLGFTFTGSSDPKLQLLNYLREKHILMVLDNVEHLLVDAAPQSTFTDLLIEILQSAAKVKLLITSREVMKLQGEYSFEIQGLSVPQPEQLNGLDKYSAVSLFVQRAAQARPGFELNAENKIGVLRVCQLVEGLPLAIELAAVWVRLLSPMEIAHEIEISLDFLSTQMRNLPQRHQSMRAVFDHSWQLLTEDEQRVLRQMSVFHGSFTREAAKAIVYAGLDLLSTLVAKSLLRRTGEGRYSLHELVHQYSAAHLAQVPEEEKEALDRHSAYYTEYVASMESKLKGSELVLARAAIDADIDNIRSGWRRAVKLGHIADVRKPIKAFWCFYDMRGWYQEAEANFTWASEEIDAALHLVGETDGSAVSLRDYLRGMGGWFHLRRGKLDEAEKLLQSSLDSLRSFGASAELTDVLYYAGAFAWMTGDYPRAKAYMLDELVMAEKIGGPWDIGQASIGLGLVTQSTGEYEEAQLHWQRALEMHRSIGDQRGTAFVLNFSCILKRTIGAYAEAQASLRECLALSNAVGDRLIYGMAMSQLGLVTQALGHHVEAVNILDESVSLLRELDEFWSLLHALLGLGEATLSTGDPSAAHAAYHEALQMAWQRQALPEVLEAMMGIARWSIQQDALEQALMLTLFVLNHPAATESTKEVARQMHEEMASRLSQDTTEAIQGHARSTSFENYIQQLVSDNR